MVYSKYKQNLVQIFVFLAEGKITENVYIPSLVSSTNSSISLGRRHGDVRKSSSSGSSSPLLPGVSSGMPSVGISDSFHGNFLPNSVIPSSGDRQHLLPPPLLLMPPVTNPRAPSGSPPISSSSPSLLQTSNKLLVKPHPHRFIPSNPQIPSLPLSSNPYFSMQDNLENHNGKAFMFSLINFYIELIFHGLNNCKDLD